MNVAAYVRRLAGAPARIDIWSPHRVAYNPSMFRFTIRELVLVTIVVAMGLSWWLDRASLAAAKAEAVEDARCLTQFFDVRLVTEPKLEPVRTMYSRKYPQKVEPLANVTSSAPLSQPR